MKRGATISIVARAVALAACAAGAAAPAGAAPIFQFGTGSGSYTVLPGGRVEVPIFLQENSSAVDPSIIEPEGGLFSVGLRVDPVAPQPGAASVLSPSDLAFNPQFTDVPFVQGVAPLAFVVSDEAGPGPVGDAVAEGVRRVAVATVTFTAGNTVGQTSTFRISDFNPDPLSADTGTYAGFTRIPPTELPVLPGEFSITVVPEPGGIATATACVAALSAMRRRRRSDRMPLRSNRGE